MENFIHTFQLTNSKLCDDLIELYNHSHKRQGLIKNSLGTVVDKSIKDSTEMIIDPMSSNRFVTSYLKQLKLELENYYKKFTHLPKISLQEKFNIQYYPKGGGYKKWHSEKSVALSKRYLVFMTYLNTVPNAGTEWLYQNYKTEAIKGLSVIWPSSFTHTHRGIISDDNEKYIITGWLNLI